MNKISEYIELEIGCLSIDEVTSLLENHKKDIKNKYKDIEDKDITIDLETYDEYGHTYCRVRLCIYRDKTEEELEKDRKEAERRRRDEISRFKSYEKRLKEKGWI